MPEVKLRVVGLNQEHPAYRRFNETPWPQDWPVPRIDDEVTVAAGGYSITLYVRHFEFMLSVATEEGGEQEPYIYVVLSNQRRGGIWR